MVPGFEFSICTGPVGFVELTVPVVPTGVSLGFVLVGLSCIVPAHATDAASNPMAANLLIPFIKYLRIRG
jgi:hypothetical protein